MPESKHPYVLRSAEVSEGVLTALDASQAAWRVGGAGPQARKKCLPLMRPQPLRYFQVGLAAALFSTYLSG